ncbi:MAG TPA: hypothetical protein VGR31_15975 [Planctomycetota bacterium]|jgi:hypothetical protein|nr:hypothetical protein [Planctomycetota bacterium]
MGSTSGSSGTSSPDGRRRLAIALAVGIPSALFAWSSIRSGSAVSDFAYWWTAARVVAHGGDPYALQPGSAGWPLPDPFFYPLPAVFPILPIAWLPLPIAGGIFMGISGGLLAWCLARERAHRLWMFASAPYVLALRVGQCSPVLLAAAFLPWLGWLLPWKPQIGLPAFAFRPTRVAALLAACAVAASFVVLPGWVAGWRGNVALLEFHPIPLLTWAGPLLLLGVLRWRTPEGRLFLAMICVPQELFFADQLPLQLIARTRRQSALLAAASLAAFAGWFALLRSGDLYVLRAAPWVLGLVYLPALGVLLWNRRERAT